MKKLILALGIVFLFTACKKDIPQKQLTVNVTPEVGGSVTPSTGTYTMGSNIKLLATPSPEYIFKEWSGGYSGTSNPANIVMDADKIINAVFEKREYQLSLTIVGSGTVKEEVIKIASSATNYKSGTTVRLTPQPSTGFQFKKWSGDDTSSKSPLEIVVSKATNLTCTFEKMEIVSLKIENPIDTLVLSKIHKYNIKGIYTDGSTIDLSDSVQITASNSGITISSDRNITATKSGNVKIKLSYKNLNLEDGVFISNIENIPIHEYLSTPALNSQLIVPVVILNWIPSKNGSVVDSSVITISGNQDWGGISKYGMTVKTVNQWILSNDLKVKFGIEEGSKFRGYSNSSATPYVGIKVIKYINIYEMPLVSSSDNLQGTNILIPDYKTIFDRINLKSLVETMGVKEVWINWTNTGNIWVPESNMSSPTTGDISNSYKRQTDLPIYNKTYVVYGSSFDRWFAEMLHCRGHQIEAQMAYLNGTFFWQDFVGYPKGAPQPYNQGGRCGSTHYTPNSVSDYDYTNTTKILSDIGDWNPNNDGAKKLVNNETWTYKRSVPFQVPLVENHTRWNDHAKYVVGTDSQSGWLIYWFQSIPSNFPIKYSQNGIEKSIENWWDIFYNWDDAIKRNKNLYK